VKLLTPRWRTPLVFVGVLLLIGVLAPAVSAAPGAATATVTPGTVPAGTTGSFTFTLTPTSGQISSFNLTAPSGWTIDPLVSPPAGVTRPSASQIQGRSLSISSSTPFSLSFTAQAACGPASAAWSVVAKSGPNFNGSTSSVNQPTTTLSGFCTAAFVTGRGPADAAFNGGAKSENITSVPYTPTGAAMQVQVFDAASPPQPRAGIAITLSLQCAPPDSTCAPPAGGASLTGPVTATTAGAAGIATFTGSTANPIAIDKVGLRYRLDPTGSGIASTPSAEFGIYEEGENCGSTCVVRGGRGGIDATVTANTPSGTMGVLVSPLDLSCEGSTPPDYEYQPLSSQVVAWKYTGTGSQTISVRVDKALVHGQTDRGNDIDVCFLVEGVIPGTEMPKSFVDKFGELRTEADGPGLLPFCSPTITHDCVVSETAISGGDRLITFTVDDGRGKI
jgi:hypothetical protein